MLLWVICVILFIALSLVLVHQYYVKKSIRELKEQYSQWLKADSNVYFHITGRDRTLLDFVNELNRATGDFREAQLKYYDGNREVTEAISNISHDLRTPITAISGYIDLIEQEEKPEQIDKYIKYIKNRTDALKGMTEELFKYSMLTSKPENITITKIDIIALIEENVAGFYTQFKERGIELEINMPEARIYVNYDYVALNRILQNILNNALKYTKGDIRIDLTERAVISVSNKTDNLDPLLIGKLFNRFFTIKNSSQSTGLGLTISKMLVDDIGGSIHAEYNNSVLKLVVDLSDCI